MNVSFERFHLVVYRIDSIGLLYFAFNLPFFLFDWLNSS